MYVSVMVPTDLQRNRRWDRLTWEGEAPPSRNRRCHPQNPCSTVRVRLDCDSRAPIDTRFPLEFTGILKLLRNLPRGTHRVLLIAGERHIARLIEVNLQRAGIRVTVCYSFAEARPHLTPHGFDLIILQEPVRTEPYESANGFLTEVYATPGLERVPVIRR